MDTANLAEIFNDVCKDCADRVCCKYCFQSDGHFYSAPSKEIEELKLKYGWDKNGFLGASGCRLPMELRSNECLKYICPAKITKERTTRVDAICNEIMSERMRNKLLV